jgi:hypothetical protein
MSGKIVGKGIDKAYGLGAEKAKIIDTSTVMV